MRKILTIFLIIFVVMSGCTIIKYREFLEEKEALEEKDPIIKEFMNPLPEDNSEINLNDIEMYYSFQTSIACGKSYNNLIQEFNTTTKRIVKIGEKVNKEKLKKEVSERMLLSCPEYYEQIK